jgi:rod shape-determining protein MreD
MQVKDRAKSRRWLFILALIGLVVQVMVAPYLTIANGQVNALMVCAFGVALAEGGSRGVVAGFVAGLLYDLLTTGPIGLMALLLTIASFVLGAGNSAQTLGERRSWLMAVAAAAAVELIYWLVCLAWGGAGVGVLALLAGWVPSVVLDALALALMIFCLVRILGGGSGLQTGAAHQLARKSYSTRGMRK